VPSVKQVAPLPTVPTIAQQAGLVLVVRQPLARAMTGFCASSNNMARL
jgi:hypothetical protein